MTRGIENNMPRGSDWMPRAVYELGVQVRELLSGRRILNAAQIDKGGIQVINGGAVTVNPGGTSVTLKTIADPSTGNVLGSQLAFGSSDPTKASKAAGMFLADGGTPQLYVQGFPNDNGDTGLIYFGPNLAQLQASDTPSGGLAHVGVAAGAGSPYPSGAVVLSANFSQWLFHGDGSASSYMDAGNLRWVAVDNSSTVQEWRAQTTSATYVPIRAAAFTVTSSREVKTNIVEIPFDALATVMAAEPMQWRYDEAFAADPNTHVSPMAEDLPEDLVHEADGVKSIDPLSLTGTLWAAVRQLSDQVAAQQKQIDELQRAGGAQNV